MSILAIDLLTADFYKTISFKNGDTPDLISIKGLFYGDGILVNNSFSETIPFTAETFIQRLEAQIAAGELLQFVQHEINSQTEMFGKVAQRVSVYEYTLADYETERHPLGVNYIQFVEVEDHWKITSMVWSDENELYQLPPAYLPLR